MIIKIHCFPINFHCFQGTEIRAERLHSVLKDPEAEPTLSTIHVRKGVVPRRKQVSFHSCIMFSLEQKTQVCLLTPTWLLTSSRSQCYLLWPLISADFDIFRSLKTNKQKTVGKVVTESENGLENISACMLKSCWHISYNLTYFCLINIYLCFGHLTMRDERDPHITSLEDR